MSFSVGSVSAVNCPVLGLQTTAVVGTALNFSVALYDAYSNRITSPSVYTSPPNASAICASTPAATATGGRSVSQVGVWSTNDLAYHFTLNLTVACIYTLKVTASDGSVLSGHTYSLTYQPGNVSAAMSTVTPSSSSQASASAALATTAGASVSLTIQLNDPFGNPVDPSLTSIAPNATVLVTVADGATSTSKPATTLVGPALYTGQLGRYSVLLTPYKATVNASTPWAIAATLSGVRLTPPYPLNVSVNAAAISSANVSYPSTVLAGNPFILGLALWDAYHNPAQLTSTIFSLTGFVSTPAGTSIGLSVGSTTSDATFFTNTNPSPTAYFTFIFNSTQTAGVYGFTVRGNGVLVPQANISFTSLAESIYVPNTVTTSVLNATVVGQPSAVTLQLRDVYGNVISNASYTSLLSVQLWTWSGTYTCDPTLWSDDTVMPGVATTASPHIPQGALTQGTVTFNAATSLYTIPYRVFISGRYTINVTVGGVPLPCLTLLPALAQNFLPAAPSANTSQVIGVPTSTVAGQTITLSVDLYDVYGNAVTGGVYAVAVPTALSAIVPSSLPSAVSADPSTWMVGALTSLATDAGGRYTVTAQPTVAQYYAVVITLNSIVLQTFSTDSTSDVAYNVSSLFPVIPSAPSAVSVFALPANITAAIPFSLLAEVSDAYGNFVSLSNPWYAISLSLQGQTQSPSDYTFMGVSANVTLPPTSSLYNASVAYGQQSSVLLQWTATSVWTGLASLQVTGYSSASTAPFSSAVAVTILPATCAALSPSTPFRCVDGSCASSYTQCSVTANGGSTPCPASSPYQCSSTGLCAADPTSCSCPFGLSRCSLSNVCVVDLNTDCFPPFTGCPSGTVACVGADGSTHTGQCRFSLSACPSPAVCPPGYALCPDLVSCASSNATCSDWAALDGAGAWTPVTASVALEITAGPFRCPDGTYVAQFSDCSTPKTCAAGQVLCLTDQSCQASAAQCPAPYTCYGANSFRCPTGECRSSAADCPASITCPLGYLRCDNDGCVTALSQCLASFNCSASQVRCSDGSCAPNLLLCPATLTCPLSAPVSCSDGSCAASAQYCPSPSACPSALNGALCPDGSCVQSGAVCSTGHACPMETPVLCDDSVTCTSTYSLCPNSTRCAAPNVIRCPDGSCRRATGDCPTSTSCPANRPIRCLDSSCAYATTLCPTISACPTTTPIRCGGGECVENLGLCPTHVTCSPGTSRCADGSCRFSCPTTVELTCATGTVACPQASSGIQCVADLTQCPQEAICPPSAPVRCVDVSCAATVAACPVLAVDPPSTLLPCPDGSWTADVTTCGTLVTCPAAYPYKCLDETCRLSPVDCVAPAPCSNSSSATQYRCLNGACVNALTDAQCQTNSRVSCPATTPYKCVGSGEKCVADVSLCPLTAVYSPTLPSVGTSGTLALSSLCPTGFVACRDASCVSDINSCPASSTCPVYLPYLCPTGVCAANVTACPDPITGCYPLSATPHGCWNGICVGDASQCPTSVPANCNNYCTDGSCPPVSITQPSAASSWCTLNGHNCALYCTDGSCGILPSDPTQTNLCTAGGALTGAGSSTHPGLGNVCPAWSPVRCDTGLCVTSQLNCTTLPSLDYCPYVAGGSTPYQCANGDCVVSAIQCAVVYPCPTGLVRCGDATCRLAATCPPYGNTCPTASPLIAALPDGSNRHPRCDNGLCAPGMDLTSCVDMSSGCAPSAPYRCGNGACVVDSSQCGNVTLATSNGCPAATPIKCSNGQCSDAQANCPLANGCPISSPYRCVAGDGTCQSSSAACSTTGCSGSRCADGSCPASIAGSPVCPAANGCPALTPWRCADGSCRKYPATALKTNSRLNRTDLCPLAVLCPTGQALCFDGSCAASASLCPPAASQCPTTAPMLCPDLSCAASTSACAQAARLATSCPTSVPLVCDSGACVSSTDQCYINAIPGVSAGAQQPFTLNNGAAVVGTVTTVSSAVLAQTGNATLVTPTPLCPPALPYACFDGSCRSSWSACQTWSLVLHGQASNSSDVDQLTAQMCDSNTEVLCPNGYCAPATCQSTDLACVELGCGVIAACDPSYTPIRCPDGSCVNTTTICPAMPSCPSRTILGYVAFTQERCEDGACRVSCLPFDGCPLSAPYACSNRECASSASQCRSEALGSMFVFESSDLQEVVTPSSQSMASGVYVRSQGKMLALEAQSASVGAEGSVVTADTSAASVSPAASIACWSACWSEVKASGRHLPGQHSAVHHCQRPLQRLRHHSVLPHYPR